jgi:ribosomal protein S18 acetylase RimI-like enzyme
LLPSFLLADDGTVLIARDGTRVVGHVQMIVTEPPATWELKSLAVAASHRRRGLGRELVAVGLAHARDHGARRVLLATAAADVGLLHFYQRLGFRLLRVERDAFTPAAGYPPDLFVDGVRVLDRVWLDREW